MKSIIRSAGLFMMALFLGIILAPRANSVAHQTGSAFQGQVQKLISQAQNYVDAVSPITAAHLATAMIVVGLTVAVSMIYLLVFVPIRIFSMQREIRRQREQIAAMKSEIRLSSELFHDARREHQGRGIIENDLRKKENVEARSRMHRLIFPERPAQPAKHDGR